MAEFTNDGLKELFIDLYLQDMLDLHDNCCAQWNEFGVFHESKSFEFIHTIMDCVSFESIEAELDEDIDSEHGF